MTDSKPHFDRHRTITAYRDLIRERDASSSDEVKEEYGIIAQRLRDIWKHWTGRDDLHDAAFGKSG